MCVATVFICFYIFTSSIKRFIIPWRIGIARMIIATFPAKSILVAMEVCPLSWAVLLASWEIYEMPMIFRMVSKNR